MDVTWATQICARGRYIRLADVTNINLAFNHYTYLHINDPLGCIGQVGRLSDFRDFLMLGCEQYDKKNASISNYGYLFWYSVCNDKLP